MVLQHDTHPYKAFRQGLFSEANSSPASSAALSASLYVQKVWQVPCFQLPHAEGWGLKTPLQGFPCISLFIVTPGMDPRALCFLKNSLPLNHTLHRDFPSPLNKGRLHEEKSPGTGGMKTSRCRKSHFWWLL